MDPTQPTTARTASRGHVSSALSSSFNLKLNFVEHEMEFGFEAGKYLAKSSKLLPTSVRVPQRGILCRRLGLD